MKNFLVCLALMAGLCACEGYNKALVQFALTSDQSTNEYKALYLNVEGIEYKAGNDWVPVSIAPFTVDLMDLTNGKDTLLGMVELESGEKVSEVRLILGDKNKLELLDGTLVDIKTPSGDESGLKFKVHSTGLVANSYIVTVDFNVEKSLGRNGGYTLNPKANVYINEITANVTGHITPADEKHQVRVVVCAYTVWTASDPKQNGYFLLQGVTEGTYNFEFLDAKGKVKKTITHKMKRGEDYDFGVIDMNN